MKAYRLIISVRTFAFVLMLGFIAAHVRAESSGSKEDIDIYFEKLRVEFDRIANASTVKKPKISPVDGYFVGVLKKHQTIYSLLRTNSKGVIINEVIRGEKPSRDYRGVSTQGWFQKVSTSLEPYYGFLKDENGRYYLFWCSPIVIRTKAGSQRFNGAVAAKIDVWDSFHKISASFDQPFLVKLGNISLYSHKWQKGIVSDLLPIQVAGTDRLSVRLPRSQQVSTDAAANSLQEVAAPTENADSGSETAFEVAGASAPEKTTAFPFSLKIGKYRIAIFGLLLILIPAALLIRFLIWFKNWRLMKRIERDDF